MVFSLSAADPAAVTVVAPAHENGAGVLFVCEHASNAMPACLGDMGLSEVDRQRHIAFDPGALAVAQRLVHRFAAPLVYAGFSRLVLDPNRLITDPTLIVETSDGTVIPPNQDLTPEDRAARIAALYTPYHAAVAQELDALCARLAARSGREPVVVSVHSFTPVMNGVARPWHVGVMWNKDDRLARPLIDALRARGEWVVGDNEPYSGKSFHGTLSIHADPKGIASVLIEIRQDLLTTEAGITTWADVLAESLAPLLGTL